MKLNTKNTIFVGLAFMLICMFWQVYDNVIAKILIDSFGLNQTWSGLVMALDNILAIVLLPIFGKLSDDTKTKWGKRTPYIVIGTVLAAALIVLIGFIDQFQINELTAANIKGIETLISNGSIVTSDGISIANGESYYMYENILYSTKELASAARSLDVAQVRDSNIFIFIAFIGVLLLVLVAMASFRTPAVSLMPDVTVKPLRSKANAIINLMGTAGGIIALGFMSFLAKDYKSYIGTFVVLAVLMIICLVVFLITVNEKKLVEKMLVDAKAYGIDEEVVEEVEDNTPDMPKDVRKSFFLILASIVFWFMAYNAATTKFSVYASTILETGYTIPLLIAQAAAVISYIPIGIISSKVGRKRTIQFGIIILFIAFFGGSFVTKDTDFLIWVVMALAGIGWASINVNSYPMVVEMSKGSNVGKYTGIYYTASMAAQIITPVLSGFIMDITGTMKVLFPYSAIFCVLAFITMWFVAHGDSKPIPVKTIEAFNQED